jgi:hypothetical protein
MSTFNRRTPRTVLATLALVATVALASFIDFLATDYAVAQRDLARATASPIVAALHSQER